MKDEIAQNFYTTSSTSSSAGQSVAANSASSSNVNFNFINFFEASFIESVITTFSIFLIIWSISVSFNFISNFYFYYKYENDLEESRILVGETFLNKALQSWLMLSPYFLFYTIYLIVPGALKIIIVALLILSGLLKIYFDSLNLLDKHSYFSWFEGLTQGIKRLLTLSKK